MYSMCLYDMHLYSVLIHVFTQVTIIGLFLPKIIDYTWTCKVN